MPSNRVHVKITHRSGRPNTKYVTLLKKQLVLSKIRNIVNLLRFIKKFMSLYLLLVIQQLVIYLVQDYLEPEPIMLQTSKDFCNGSFGNISLS